MTAAIALFLLCAPASQKQWSKQHDVGVWFPPTWEVTARDQGRQAFVVKGPKLGPGWPRAVLWNAGKADGRTLPEFTETLRKQVAARPGWSVTATVRKTIGAFPCMRIGLRFVEDGIKGRARFTTALLGGNYFVLEMSAAASHFPGATFDRIERSLEVKWAKHTVGSLVLHVPPGWGVRADEGTLRLHGPRLDEGVTMLVFEPSEELRGPEGAKPGATIEFLGGARATLTQTRKGARLTVVHADGWIGVFILPVAVWDDLFPTVAAILRKAEIAKPK